MSSQTERFLSSNKYILPAHDKNGLTHTLLDGFCGGRVRLPEDKKVLNDFLVAYATDVENGKTLFVNEMRRDHFRMFLDLDIMHTNILTEEEILEIMNEVYITFKRFFPDGGNKHQFLCVVSDADPKSLCVDHQSLTKFIGDKDKLKEYIDQDLCNTEDDVVKIDKTLFNDWWKYNYNTIFELEDGSRFRNTHRVEGRLKHGIHAIFPKIIVTFKEALYMREALLDALTSRFGTKYAHKGWCHVVDNAVYVNSGLRMIYSSKTKNCEVCKNNAKDRATCTAGCRHGKDLSEGRKYKLKFVCDDGKLNEAITEEFRRNTVKLLYNAIIYTQELNVSQNWVKFNGCPSYGDIVEMKSNGPPKLASKERYFIEENKQINKWKRKISVTDPDIIAICEKHIRTRFVKEYKELRVRSIVRDDYRLYVTVDGLGSNFCLNKSPPGDHKSNRIWFSVEPDGIRARCFCSCPTTEGRQLGLCKDFKTPAKGLNASELTKIFPKKSDNPMFADTPSMLLKMNTQVQNKRQKS